SLSLSIHICNEGTDYACICDNSTSSSLSLPSSSSLPSSPSCSHFIEPSSLPSVGIRVRHVNLDAAKGHNGEKYERFFKKRIATIVSAYCERKTNECPGVALVLNPDNVILLRTLKEPLNITRILFNVVKSGTLAKGAILNEDTILDPVKVKYILGSQPGPLARILGGVRVESVRVNEVHGGTREEQMGGEKKEKDNTQLIVIIIVVATFFIICYIIGIYKLIRDCKKRKQKKATESTQMVQKEPEVKSTNYGSIVTHQPNGSTVVSVTEQRTVSSPLMGHCYTRPSSSLDASTLPRPRLSDRQALLMFGCDPSQLPKEASIDTGLDEVAPSECSLPPSTITPPLPISHTPGPSIPAVVLLSSHSLSRDSPLVDPIPPSSIDNEIVPPHRPKSRRGSRVDDGIETIDLTERRVEPEFSEEAVHRSLQKRLTDEAWSSSEGEVDVYYKLSEEEGEGAKGDEWPNGINPSHDDPSNVVIFSPPRKNREVMQDDSSDEEMDRESSIKDSVDVRDEDDIHGYERLREELSPLPPPTHPFSQHSHDMR
ncbi:hypothetical protein PMAYCL1PPCAC_12376, partial [Pristionchus mayeri]